MSEAICTCGPDGFVDRQCTVHGEFHVVGDCLICGEPVMEREAAEMYEADLLEDPELFSEARSGIVHAECGLAKGWKVA